MLPLGSAFCCPAAPRQPQENQSVFLTLDSKCVPRSIPGELGTTGHSPLEKAKTWAHGDHPEFLHLHPDSAKLCCPGEYSLLPTSRGRSEKKDQCHLFGGLENEFEKRHSSIKSPRITNTHD